MRIRWTEQAVDQRSAFPDSGRIVPERGGPTLRELVRPPYRIVYERTEDVVVILTIFQAARMFPEHLEPPRR